MPKSAVLLLASLVLMAALIPAPASAEAGDGAATIPAGGHLVLLNFTVTADHFDDPANAGNVRWLVYLDQGSMQDSFDVFVMTADDYQAYVSGGVFQLVIGWGAKNVGPVPSYNLVYLFGEGDYVLLIDNTDVGDITYTPAELKVHYEYDAQNVEVTKETRWDLFIALMVLIALLGAVFLLLLNMWVKHRMDRVDEERRKRCSNCGRVSIHDGEYCPYCGKVR
ncbi:MAG TPA: hypothetical protein PKJ15_00315 [Methanomassiliicoccales archaeon]|nr:hypothetical protein [Methanomassiliicoccales archaeon]